MRRYLLATVSALFLILSFPGFDIWILAWVALVPLFFAIDGQKPLAAFLTGYLTGFLFFLVTMYWLIHVTLPGMLAVVAYLALYFGSFAAILSIVKGGRPMLFFIPSAWVALEWIRTHALTGFGWNLLGYSQGNNLPVIQIADMTGAYGVGFVIVMFNAAIYMLVKNFKRDRDAYLSVALAGVTLLAVLGYGVFRLNNVFTGEKFMVAIVQGNIPQDQKWDRNFAEMILARYEGLTRGAAVEKPDLVIWPESSTPGFVENEEEILSRVTTLVRDINTPLLVGSPRYEETKNGTSYYNSAFLFKKDGSIGGRYDKVHLVPFGEYVPLKNLFFFVHKFAPRPIGDFEAGKDLTVFRSVMERSSKDNNYSWKLVKKVGFSALICFEDIFPDIARTAGKNADFLVNITNDAWFGRSSAAYQHARASVFRAVENRINVIRAANTGLSCFIDQKGRITARVTDVGGKDLFVPGSKTSEITLSRARTVYTGYGDVFAYACIAFALFWSAASLRKDGFRRA